MVPAGPAGEAFDQIAGKERRVDRDRNQRVGRRGQRQRPVQPGEDAGERAGAAVVGIGERIGIGKKVAGRAAIGRQRHAGDLRAQAARRMDDERFACQQGGRVLARHAARAAAGENNARHGDTALQHREPFPFPPASIGASRTRP
jgi:hypothetical protein